jgi:hypothetical protein
MMVVMVVGTIIVAMTKKIKVPMFSHIKLLILNLNSLKAQVF